MGNSGKIPDERKDLNQDAIFLHFRNQGIIFVFKINSVLDKILDSVYNVHYMESYNLSLLTKRIYESKLSLVSSKTLKDILEIQNKRSFFKIIQKFQKNGIIRKIERDKYQISNKNVSDFEMANFLYELSYISLETALNYWGILSQFPFEITSVTNKKSLIKRSDDKVFSYSHLSVNLFGMFVKKENFLIATPEKALFDQLYLTTRGWKTANLDEYDLERIEKKIFLDLCKRLKADKKIMKLVSDLKW